MAIADRLRRKLRNLAPGPGPKEVASPSLPIESSLPKFQTEVVDLDYYQHHIPCQDACPVHTDARGYIQAILRGEWEWGYALARQPNPFASACGRVCVAPCEAACRRGKVDAPIPIRALKRFLTQRFGVEGDHTFPSKGSGPDNSATWESYSSLGRHRVPDGGKMAIIGSGPAGLTCAHDLALLGHKVTVFEALPHPGGNLGMVIPDYRLPRSLIRQEVEAVLKLGVELNTSSAIGREIPISYLRTQGYKALFLAMGMEKKQHFSSPEEGVFATTDIGGVEGQGIIHAVAIGHRAAFALDSYLTSRQWRVERRARLVPVAPEQLFSLDYLHRQRQDPPLAPFAVSGEMENPYAPEAAVAQAQRCLKCHIQTVFDGEKCILCNGCVDVCPMSCLKLVRIESIHHDQEVAALMEENARQGGRPVAGMLKDETRCIRCGLCARRCPTGAVQMMAFWFEEELAYA